VCGRFTLTTSQHDVIYFVEHHFSIQQNDFLSTHQPTYNVAPTQSLITILSDGKINKGGYLPWGFPFEGQSTKTFIVNARSETVMEKPMFRSSYRGKRCLVLADGFYEWNRKEKPSQPYYFHLPNHSIFAFAGLWNHYLDKEGKKQFAVTLLTTASSQTIMEPIHDRLPVVLSPDQYQFWLNKQTPIDELAFLLKPYNAPSWEKRPISTYVNKVIHNDPQCIETIKK
jgi:putative SOS response-associated peptidase YedK